VSGKPLTKAEFGGWKTFDLLMLIRMLDIAPYPGVNPENLDEYAWRVHVKTAQKIKEVAAQNAYDAHYLQE
jgi:hypothetical protein